MIAVYQSIANLQGGSPTSSGDKLILRLTEIPVDQAPGAFPAKTCGSTDACWDTGADGWPLEACTVTCTHLTACSQRIFQFKYSTVRYSVCKRWHQREHSTALALEVWKKNPTHTEADTETDQEKQVLTQKTSLKKSHNKRTNDVYVYICLHDSASTCAIHKPIRFLRNHNFDNVCICFVVSLSISFSC